MDFPWILRLLSSCLNNKTVYPKIVIKEHPQKKVMKVLILLTIVLLYVGHTTNAQNCPKGSHSVNFSPSSQVQIFACVQDKISSGKQSVFWGAKNLTNDELNIKFVKVVTTTCGNVLKDNGDTHLKPGEFVGGTTFFGEITFETQVWSEDCSNTTNRIGSVSYEGLTIENVSKKERDRQAKEDKEKADRETQAKMELVQKEREYKIATDEKSRKELEVRVQQQNNAQKQSYQTQASNYLQQAQDPNQDGIMQQLNLNLAKTNAVMAGDKEQIQQIDQLQYQVTQQQNDQLAQGITSLATGIFDLVEQNREKKEKERERQEQVRREQEQAAAEERRQQAELARIQAEKEAAFNRFLSLFQPSIPNVDNVIEEIYFVPVVLSGNQVKISEIPIKVSKNLFHQWTDPKKIANFIYEGAIKINSNILMAGYFKDLISAQNAIFDMQSLLPETGRDFASRRFEINEEELNKYLADEAVRLKQEAELANRKLMISSLVNALPSYTFPNSQSGYDSLSCFIVGYINSLTGLSIGMSNIFQITKISDGTWPLRQTIELDMKNQLHSFTEYFYVGFLETSVALKIYDELKSTFETNRFSLTKFAIQLTKPKIPKLNQEFWNK